MGAEPIGPASLRLFHERAPHRTGELGTGDEEECFTAVGRRTGVWLTTERLAGPTVVAGDVHADLVAPFDVSGADAEHRVYVVPAATCGTWSFG